MIKKISKYKAVMTDIVLNLVSTTILISVVQLLIFPQIAQIVSKDVFGRRVSLYGINNVLIIFLGNTLNNIRLLNQKKTLNYSLLVYLINNVCLITISIFVWIYGEGITLEDKVCFILSTMLANNRSYISVDYRIRLKYNQLLIQNIFIILGYILGFIVFYLIGTWGIIFLLGEIAGFLYIKKTGNMILKEYSNLKLSKDPVLLNQFTSLSFSNALSSSLNYLDRFLIIPILGSYSMAVFYAASAVSKILTMIITPITNVLLSYLTGSNRKIKIIMIRKISFILTVCMIPMYIILNYISTYLVLLLYPTLAEHAVALIPVVSVGIIVSTMSSVFNILLLKFYSINYQMIIQIIYAVIYLLLALVLSVKMDLFGFALSYAIASSVRYIIQNIVIFLGNDQANVVY